MNYLVLARKYRPGRFEDVVAQEHVTRTLTNALKNSRVGSAYLFCGPRGTGKTTIARILAKAVNCAEGPTASPCGKCVACNEITSGASLDVLEIDAASNTGVDDIRTLRENVRYLPANGRFRIYIIDEVHRLSSAAFDALLKTLEEPPPHVIFMMATTEPLKVPDTILSRTQRFDFKRVSTDDLARHLKKIADLEKFNFSDSALRLLARKGDGSVRDALSLMDQITAFAGDKITDQDIINGLGLVDGQFLFDFVEAIGNSDSQRILILVKSLFDNGIDTSDFVTELLEHLRSLMILSASPESTNLINLNDDEITNLKAQAKFFTIGDILRIINILSELHSNLKFGLDERLLLETAAVKMTLMESTIRFEEIINHLKLNQTSGDKKETHSKNMTGSPSSLPSPPHSHRTISQHATSQGNGNGSRVDLECLKKGWKGFVSLLRKSSAMLASYLPIDVIQSIEGDKLKLALPSSDESIMEVINKPENKKLINNILSQYFNVNLSVVIEIDHTSQVGKGSKNDTTKNIDPQELIAKSPHLKSLLDRVDGEIIGIKRTED